MALTGVRQVCFVCRLIIPGFFDWVVAHMVAILHCSKRGYRCLGRPPLDNAQLKLGCLRPGITLALISSMWMCLLTRGCAMSLPNVLLDRVGTGKKRKEKPVKVTFPGAASCQACP